MRDSKGVPKTLTVSWLGPMRHVSAIRTQGSEEQVVEYSLASTTGEQKNNRAELLDVTGAMQVHDGNLVIRSDSDYAVRIATRRTRGETQKRNEGNADEFGTALRFKATRRLDTAWVKGHATKLHIDLQITTTLDKGGNDASNSLASAAAAHHVAPQALTEVAIGRQRTAMVTHSFASELLFRRRVALLALHEADHR